MKRRKRFAVTWLLVTFALVGTLFAFGGVVYAFSPDTDLSNADASFCGDGPGDRSGLSVAAAGDVNNDGYDDFLIGAPNDDHAGPDAGQTYLILGDPAVSWGMGFSLSSADASFCGEDSLDWSGWSVAAAGDVNNDGYDDFLIGAIGNDYGGHYAGQTYLILGSHYPANTWGMQCSLSSANASFLGKGAGDWSGFSVASAGDVNNDDYDDFLIGAVYNDDGGTDAGQTYLMLGNPDPATTWRMGFNLSGASISFRGEDEDDWSGHSVASAGDVNNDDYDDFLIGAPMDEYGGYRAGQSYLILGDPHPTTTWGHCSLSSANASFLGQDPDDQSGLRVASAGNVNGDDYDDFLIGAYADEAGGFDAGQTYLILGDPHPTTTWGHCSLSSANASFLGEGAYDQSGLSVASAGDVNGDTLDDFLIGARYNDDGGYRAGQTYLMLGSTTTWRTGFNLSGADASFWGEDEGDWSGYSVAPAGDVNGDTYYDFLIGAPMDEDGGTEAGQTYLLLGRPLKGQWKPVVMNNSNQVMMAPVVADITDGSKRGPDGVPDIIFATFNATYGPDPGHPYLYRGIIRVISGGTLTTHYSIIDPDYLVIPTAGIAVADLDADGYPEIIAITDGQAPPYGYRLICFNGEDGTWEWTSDPPFLPTLTAYACPAIADINQDGAPEIIVGDYVFDRYGKRWAGWPRGGSTGRYISCVADLDGMPGMEIICGNSAYDWRGNSLWPASTVPDGFNAVADFDKDDHPEIVVVGNGRVYLLDRAGSLLWGPVDIETGPIAGMGGPPCVADFDGDGYPEIGVAGNETYAFIEAWNGSWTGTITRKINIQDYSSGMASSSAFDFDEDGKYDIAYRDEKYFYLFDDVVGVRFKWPCPSGTVCEMPVIADVDNDMHAEIIVPANNYSRSGNTGIEVYGSSNWPDTRGIWNQHTYHITNINDNATVPQFERDSWRTFNNYRAQPLGTPDHFKCYPVDGQPPGKLVMLEDQFGPPFRFVTPVGGPQYFCNPVAKTYGGVLTPIRDQDRHLTLYDITYNGTPQAWSVEVDNQFGNQWLNVSDPVLLAVPTQKEQHYWPVGLDHFLLHEVTQGTDMQVVVELQDQWGIQPEVATVLAPRYFANPVEKTHLGQVTKIENPEVHLVFYEITGQHFQTVVNGSNQFGGGNFTTHQGDLLLAVPSEKIRVSQIAGQPDEPTSICFIATAAYGTPMAEEIGVLGEFRDEYLLPDPVGRTLADMYYRISPPMAEFITQHPGLKPIVRGGLLPAVAMSTIVVNTTPTQKMVMAGLAVVVSVALAVWARRRGGRGRGYS